MIVGMDWLTTIPLIVGVISDLSAGALQSLAERLVTIVLAGFIVGSAGVFALTELAWLGLKRAVGELHASPRPARHWH
jgi:hypothetical protein